MKILILGTRALLLATATIPLLAPTAASAQQDAPESESEDHSGDIIVTARKRNDRLQDVPLSVNALSGDQLREQNAVDIKDVLGSVPGVASAGTERGLANYNIRGVSTVASSPTVALFLDDISLVTISTNFSGGIDPVFFDMARVEVLKGPQGTLYGGSSMGGAIKYVSARPDATEVTGQVAAGAATTRHGAMSYNGEAIVNLPVVTDKLAVRAGFSYRHEGGFIDNIANGNYESRGFSSTEPAYTPLVRPTFSTLSDKNWNEADTYVARLSAMWQPDPTWTILPALFYQEYKQKNSSQYFLNLPDLTSSYNLNQPTHDKFGIYSLTVEKELNENLTFTSLTSYVDRTLRFGRDYSSFIWTIIPPLYPLVVDNQSDSFIKTFSQELRLTYSGNGLSFVAGLYHSDQKDTLVQSIFAPELGGFEFYNGKTATREKQYAAFGEATVDLVKGFSLTAGLRLFGIKQVVNAAYDGPINGGPTAVNDRENTEVGLNPKIGLNYNVGENSLLFASVSKGFRPGGPNRFAVNPVTCASDLGALGLTAAPEAFKSDNLWTYELGSKNQFLNRKLTLNGAVFYTDWKKIHQVVNLNCGFNFTGNAGSAELKGAEVELRFSPARGLEIGGNGTYTDTKITEVAPGTSAQKGDQVLLVPKWLASAFVTYSASVNDRWTISARSDFQYRGPSRGAFERTMGTVYPSGTMGAIPNEAQFRVSSRIVNASLAFSDDATTVRLYANNIFDARPDLEKLFQFFVSRGSTFRPRTVGVELLRKF